MRKRAVYIVVLLLLGWTAGCDSSDDGNDGPSDAEIFVGEWGLARITDGDGDQTQAFLSLVVSFLTSLRADGTFDITIDYNDAANAAGQNDIDVSGTYTVNESNNTLTLTAANAVALPLSYTIENNDRITISGNALLINLAFGTNYTGTAALTIVRQ